MSLILETNRLYLKEFSIHDANFFYELNRNPNVIRFTGDQAFETISDAATFLQNYKDYEVNGYGRWAVLDKTNDAFLGWCGLKYHPDSQDTDIGFRFFEQYWNKGFATESAKACLTYGFEHLNLANIIGRVMAENHASIKVLEKIGLEFEKEFDFENLKGLHYRISRK